MIIISHRGYWNDLIEQNQLIAFKRSFDCGFGVETDLRDFKGDIVISHDMPRGGEIRFETILQELHGRNLPLALNIKADGLSQTVLALLNKYEHTNYFTFDMSIPDMVVQIKHGIRVFTGLSDVLYIPVLREKAAGIWLDCFNSIWYNSGVIDDIIADGQSVCIVSAELHKRSFEKHWKIIKGCDSLSSPKLLLCTDYPQKALEFFYDKN